jgi:hypothetical protein
MPRILEYKRVIDWHKGLIVKISIPLYAAGRMLNTRCIMNRICLSLCGGLVLFFCAPLSAGVEKIFSFPLRAHSSSTQTQAFFVGAREALAGNNFALAAAQVSAFDFIPLAPELVTLDGVAEQPNPLFGSAILHIAQLGQNPLVVHSAEPARAYFLEKFSRTSVSLVASPRLLDADGVPADAIAALTTNSPDAFVAGESRFFAYVTPTSGMVGDPGSGIASAVLTGGEPFSFIAAQADRLDATSPALAHGSPVTITSEKVIFHYSASLDRLYAAFSVRSGPQSSDGARAITAGVSPLVPSSALTADSIVGALGASRDISMHHISTTAVSSRLIYLIGVGGVGTPAETEKAVFALPLVSDPTSPSFGLLAARSALPYDIFEPAMPHRFLTRVLRDPAVNPGDIFSATDLPAQVGGGADLPGPIRELVALGDGVLVAVEQEVGATEAGGIFLSRAILDETGRVRSWTPWQRMLSAAGSHFGVAYDQLGGQLWTLSGTSGADITRVALSEWSTKGPFAQKINHFFSPTAAGIGHIASLPVTTNGFDQTRGNRLALSLFVGDGRVVCAATARDQSGVFTPVVAPQNIFESSDGTLSGFTTGADIVALRGGDLARVGPIDAAAYSFDGAQGWFVVGGTGGCSVLACADGSGISLLGAGFTGLSEQFAWRPLSVPPFVRRLIADGQFLYILTNSALYRAELTPQGIAAGSLDLVECAAAGLLPAGAHTFLSDVLVSGDRAVLATSSGLLVTADGAFLRTADNSTDLWRFFDLPEAPGGSVFLHPIAAGGPTGWATDAGGGMIEVLSASVAADQARLYRLVTSNSSSQYVQRMNDLFVVQRPAFYLSVGSYRSAALSEGIALYATRSRYFPTNSSPFCEMISPQPPVAKRSVIRQAIRTVVRDESTTITPPVRDCGAGWLMIGGDGGLILND